MASSRTASRRCAKGCRPLPMGSRSVCASGTSRPSWWPSWRAWPRGAGSCCWTPSGPLRSSGTRPRSCGCPACSRRRPRPAPARAPSCSASRASGSRAPASWPGSSISSRQQPVRASRRRRSSTGARARPASPSRSGSRPRHSPTGWRPTRPSRASTPLTGCSACCRSATATASSAWRSRSWQHAASSCCSTRWRLSQDGWCAPSRNVGSPPSARSRASSSSWWARMCPRRRSPRCAT